MRLSWQGRGRIGSPRKGPVKLILDWDTSPSGTWYQVQSIGNGKPVLGIWIAHSVEQYYGAVPWRQASFLRRRQ